MEEIKKEAKIEQGGIDKDILEQLPKDNILKVISSDEQIKRAELNFYCELLSQMKDFVRAINDFNQFVSICSSKKIMDFFQNLQTNVEDEKNRIKLQENIKKSHLRGKKRKNTAKNAVKVALNSK